MNTTQIVTIVTRPASKPMTVYYTLDGTTPTTDSPVYTSSLMVNTINGFPTNVTVFAGLNAQVNPSTPVIGNLRILVKAKT